VARICDYNGYMVATLRESKAKLSELVERASRGEEILITVHGKVKARLTEARQPAPAALGKAWADELRELHRTMKVRRKPALSMDQILQQDRTDRV
jgi:prevent-host-death family protein